ncbi:MAG: DNA polymerase III subunit gamma/tau [Rhodospirillales bacterium]|nr:DNA polymerase III subunit gamma/tau [Rhodospirillales bacterium]
MSDSETKQSTAYRVLARKYRPQNFGQLVGQDALVRTLTNAIESGRIAHAFMLTGIRGTGKTTTARIIAKALNYTGPDGKAGPTTGPTDDCEICQAISADRHPDVIEMDAASRTGVDDIREILDGVRYAPTSARYKVYIIDEVHMLSKAAFNALLKTLEEPPEHVKFIFATTEIRKVPVTVLSRCQRFDLRRIDAETLAAYYKTIAAQEGVSVDDDALALISRAADGSARDGLSLLDQAISLSDGAVSAQQVQDMLGLADRARVMDVLEHAVKGQCKEALNIAEELYRSGGDPSVLMSDLLDFTHLLTKLRAVPDMQETHAAVAPDTLARAKDLASQLSMPTLGRAWQILLKGVNEVNTAPNPQAAAEMILIRLAYASDLPDPSDLLKKLKDQPADSGAPVVPRATQAERTLEPVAMAVGGGVVSASQVQPAPVEKLETLADVVALLEQNREMILAGHVFHYAHLVKMKEGMIEMRVEPQADPKLAQNLRNALISLTGNQWMVSISSAPGAATLAEIKAQEDAALMAEIMETPVVAEIFRAFPDTKIKLNSKQ